MSTISKIKREQAARLYEVADQLVYWAKAASALLQEQARNAEFNAKIAEEGEQRAF